MSNAYNLDSLQPYQQRMIKEGEELRERLSSLRNFLKSEAYAVLGNKEQCRLLLQSMFMGGYYDVLSERIANFDEPSQSVGAYVPIGWEYRFHFSPYSAIQGWSPWERVIHREGGTVEGRVDEIRAHIEQGCLYELRELFATTWPSA